MLPCTDQPLLLTRKILLGAVLFAAGELATASSAFYSFTDDDGVERISNIPDDRRYRPLFTSPTDVSYRTVKAARGILALPYNQRPFHDSVVKASQATGVTETLLHAVITIESGYNRVAVSPKGATGLMQLLPSTAKRYGIDNLLDPDANVQAGARYLQDLLKLFDNDIQLTLAAYNAGENAVLRHGRKLPPYPETMRYVPMVVAQLQRLNSSQ